MDFAESFREESLEHLADIETLLLELEDHPQDGERIGAVFRALHTIKGSGAMFGFDEISSFTHEVENAFDAVRSGRLAISDTLIQVTLQAKDCIRALLEGQDQTQVKERILKELAQWSHASPPPPSPAEISLPSTKRESKSARRLFRLRVSFVPDCLEFGIEPEMIFEELAGLGDVQLVAHEESVPSLDEIDPGKLYLQWDVLLKTDQDENALRDVFIFVEDYSSVQINEIPLPDALDEFPGVKRLGEILLERGDLTPEALQETLNKREKLGRLLVEEGAVADSRVRSALLEQQAVREASKSAPMTKISSIRVASEKLDVLVDLVGELVTTQARLSQLVELHAGRHPDAQLQTVAEEVERITWELRENAMGIRMLPIELTFSRFKRLVHDLSQELGKQVVLSTMGGETELDKTVIEQLNDPFVHLVRNAIDHGIESPQQRQLAGKPAEGRLVLSARHSGASVLIGIRDDGAGIHGEALWQKAVNLGLVEPNRKMTDKEKVELMFHPGLSSRENVSATSGRGVGMDVVKRNIENLGGEIDIETSLGQGTTITLRLPLTLAIIEGLLIEVGGERFVIPLGSVVEVVEHRRSDSRHSLVNLRGEFVPYLDLCAQFELPEGTTNHRQIVVTKIEEEKLGLLVDQVIGEHQTVVKTLGPLFKHLEAISGATILGDGRVALIIDLAHLLKQKRRVSPKVTNL